MAYTFGGATTHDITMTPAVGCGTNQGQNFTCGWWYPTTLTATRYYASGGNLYGMEVDATTANVRFRSDNTTDGQWTAPAAVAVNRWWFMAFASCHTNTGPAGAWRLWVGSDAMSPPVEITVTNAVAPVGNHTAGTAFTAGNRGTGSLAFQGDIGWVSRISSQGNGNMLNFATAGTITNDEALLVYNNWVLPLWSGKTPARAMNTGGAFSNNFSIAHIPMDNGRASFQYSNSATAPFTAALTINGATFSQRSPPSEPRADWPLVMRRVRRAA